MEADVKTSAESYSYGEDAGKVLDLVINSLYKHKDVFLR